MRRKTTYVYESTTYLCVKICQRTETTAAQFLWLYFWVQRDGPLANLNSDTNIRKVNAAVLETD